MKVNVYDLEGKVVEQIELQDIIVREDLIRRAVLSEESKLYQPKGNYYLAGKDTSARFVGREGIYGSLKDKGQARLPRELRGGGSYGRVRIVPQSVKGRRAHPPKPEKIIVENINKKEYKLAFLHAILGSKILVFVDDIENITKTKDAYNLLSKFINLEVKRKRITGVRRKRKKRAYREKKIATIVTVKAIKSFRNIAGINYSDVENLQVRHICPGGLSGRYLVISKSALNKILEKVMI